MCECKESWVAGGGGLTGGGLESQGRSWANVISLQMHVDRLPNGLVLPAALNHTPLSTGLFSKYI